MAYPRKSILRPALSHGAAFLFMIFWLSMCLRFLGQAWAEDQAFETRGIDVEGTITQLWTEPDGASTTHLGAYTYVVDEEEFSGSSIVEPEEWAKLEVGGKILVRYVQTDPGLSASLLRRDETQKNGGRAIHSVLLFGFLGFGLAILFGIGHSFIMVRRRFWLREQGLLRRARVLKVELDEGGWDITWRDEAGVEGRASGVAEATRPEVDAAINVFAHPTKGWATVWEGEIGSRSG